LTISEKSDKTKDINKITNFLANDEREHLKTMHRKELKRRTADSNFYRNAIIKKFAIEF
jgi:rubrerythrin